MAGGTGKAAGIAGSAAVGATLLGAVLVGSFIAAKRRDRDGDDAPGRTARKGFGEYKVAGRTVTIARPKQELFAFWRDFQNLPQFMENVVSVRTTGSDGRSVWTIRAPAGTTVDVETEVVREIEGEVIAWRSVEGSQITTEGRVEFRDAPGDRGTQVTAIVAYKPPLGAAGQAVAKLFMREPAVQARHDLKRFKMLMEAGEIATSARVPSETRAAKMEEA